jgi:cytochrome c oxidase assembly protein subunit 11
VPPRRPSNARVLAVCLGVTFGMLGAAFASVPFYGWFCATTGYGGTPTVASAAPITAPGRPIEVRFDSNLHAGLPWRFAPEVPRVEVALGVATTVLFRIENTSDQTTRGVATFNVTPPLAAYWFTKLACFCFSEQVLAPHEVIEAPVTFFVDAGLDTDKNVKGLTSLTLSYTFFAAPDTPRATTAAAEGAAPPRIQ